MKKQLSLSFVFFVLSGSLAPLLLADGTVVSEAAGTSKAPIEVGDVQWSRDLDGACKESERSGKPVMVLFQEVPGCSGCQLFGARCCDTR